MAALVNEYLSVVPRGQRKANDDAVSILVGTSSKVQQMSIQYQRYIKHFLPPIKKYTHTHMHTHARAHAHARTHTHTHINTYT